MVNAGIVFLIGYVSGAAAALGLPHLFEAWRDAQTKTKAKTPKMRWDG